MSTHVTIIRIVVSFVWCRKNRISTFRDFSSHVGKMSFRNLRNTRDTIFIFIFLINPNVSMSRTPTVRFEGTRNRMSCQSFWYSHSFYASGAKQHTRYWIACNNNRCPHRPRDTRLAPCLENGRNDGVKRIPKNNKNGPLKIMVVHRNRFLRNRK